MQSTICCFDKSGMTADPSRVALASIAARAAASERGHNNMCRRRMQACEPVYAGTLESSAFEKRPAGDLTTAIQKVHCISR